MSLRSYYLFLVFFTFYFFSYSQITANWEDILTSDLTTEQKHIKIDSLVRFYTKQGKDSLLERITHKYAIWHYKNTSLDLAIRVAEQSLELKKKITPTNPLLIQHGLKNLGFFSYKQGNYSKSISYNEEIISINSKNDYAADAYSKLGRCYTNTYDYHNAVVHFELANSLFWDDKDYRSIVANAINSGKLYIKIGTVNSLKKGIENALIADSLSLQIKSRATTRYNLKIILGTLYNQDDNLNTKKASFYYDQALSIAKDLKDSILIAKTYELKGNLYNTVDQDLAIQYHQKAIRNFTKNDSVSLAISISNIGFCMVEQEKFKEGFEHYQKAISYFTGQKLNNQEASSQTGILSETLDSSHLLTTLEDLADAYLKHYRSTDDQSSLDKSINTFLLADEMIDLIRIESQEFQSKLYWRKHSSTLYGRAIEACFLAEDIDNAFYFMEKNKALILTEDISNNRLKQSILLPENIVNREIELKKSIYLLNKIKNNGSNKKELDVITIRTLDLKRNLKTLQDSIKDIFSDYSKFNTQSSPITSLKSIQKKLDHQTVLIEYNISSHVDFKSIDNDNNYTPIYEGSDYGKKEYSKGYLVYITNNESHFVQLPNIDDLKTTIDLFIKKAAIPFGTEKDIVSYSEIGYKVFKYLFPDKKIQEIISGKKLIIIPDNYLNYIPFEALVTSNDLDKTPKYLIEDSEISYGYSNFFLKNSSHIASSEGEVSFLGFAPGNFDKYNLTPIENNKNEVNNINSLFSGEALINDNATKENFLAKLENQNIIHLATHADALDSISPWIAFSDNKLDLEELYLTKNHADLVVLSGCNTLLGKQETGEGVMSLARGFFHSGAKSVVSSLWNVDDRSTSYIMNEFYKNLKNQQTKSQALREAKLKYIRNSSLSESSPHFWATFVLLGDTSPIQSYSNASVYWLILLFPMLFAFIIIYRKLKKKDS
ncbi:CHAT domain-containing tetratricopeptide repeat protein [uncultured Aquimarina sp.]|uniref:CHAT domain-containing protein n=1 Tax=uncultured Aquimarina sp. TaxID=575652 RepID=UPI00260DC944|nr:CHAT domain-containing tetratricopeptide repeat protein [uncultured Aquimarina sp.]